MKDFTDLVQKTFYFGVGVASLAAEETTKNLKVLGEQAQKLANELIDEGKIACEKISQDFDNVVGRENIGSQQQNVSPQPSEKLKKKLLTLVKGDLDTALRLVNAEKLKNPGRSEDWYWEKVIYSYERDLD
jgi:polyhydroxyalkanoate synthesis regulator phasin